MSLSTHVLDTARGEPAAGVPVRLEQLGQAGWESMTCGHTDLDGRLGKWLPDGFPRAGRYRLVFDTGTYLGPHAFYPQVVVEFAIADPNRHHHVPLLLSPFGYSTYLGS